MTRCDGTHESPHHEAVFEARQCAGRGSCDQAGNAWQDPNTGCPISFQVVNDPSLKPPSEHLSLCDMLVIASA